MISRRKSAKFKPNSPLDLYSSYIQAFFQKKELFFIFSKFYTFLHIFCKSGKSGKNAFLFFVLCSLFRSIRSIRAIRLIRNFKFSLRFLAPLRFYFLLPLSFCHFFVSQRRYSKFSGRVREPAKFFVFFTRSGSERATRCSQPR